MKRAPALQELSRDHLKALLIAKRMREADELETAAEAFTAFWNAESHHFRLEEEILLPHWAADAAVDHDAIVRMLDDHLAIRRDALRLAEERLTLEELRELGARLHDHVRFEERELFPAIERSLDDASLDRLGAALDSDSPQPRRS
jgi:hemerythrin-like domain-containing protein